jgi:DNA-binding response OmpR family regulator
MIDTKQTILIVEDQEDILDLMEYTLSKEGYDVITCIDTSNVVNILDEEEIFLMLMDRNNYGFSLKIVKVTETIEEEEIDMQKEIKEYDKI